MYGPLVDLARQMPPEDVLRLAAKLIDGIAPEFQRPEINLGSGDELYEVVFRMSGRANGEPPACGKRRWRTSLSVGDTTISAEKIEIVKEGGK
jgi:hypothetical protein